MEYRRLLIRIAIVVGLLVAPLLLTLFGLSFLYSSIILIVITTLSSTLIQLKTGRMTDRGFAFFCFSFIFAGAIFLAAYAVSAFTDIVTLDFIQYLGYSIFMGTGFEISFAISLLFSINNNHPHKNSFR